MLWEDNYLMHHGIKGQKWGIRRFQNPDGTLTEEGKRRYQYKERVLDSIKYEKDWALKSVKDFSYDIKNYPNTRWKQKYPDEKDHSREWYAKVLNFHRRAASRLIEDYKYMKAKDIADISSKDYNRFSSLMSRNGYDKYGDIAAWRKRALGIVEDPYEKKPNETQAQYDKRIRKLEADEDEKAVRLEKIEDATFTLGKRMDNYAKSSESEKKQLLKDVLDMCKEIKKFDSKYDSKYADRIREEYMDWYSEVTGKKKNE